MSARLVLVVPADSAPYVETLDLSNLNGVHQKVGGFVEPIYLSREDVALGNEDGSLLDLPYNTVASTLADELSGRFGMRLLGTICFVSRGPNSALGSVRDSVVDMAGLR